MINEITRATMMAMTNNAGDVRQSHIYGELPCIVLYAYVPALPCCFEWENKV